MSYYEGLPIYRAAADVVVTIDGVVRGFSRYHKRTLGARLRDTALDVGLPVALAVEGDAPAGNVKGRRLTWWTEPLPRATWPREPLPPRAVNEGRTA